MRARLYPIAVPVMLALAACRPGVAEYSASEAPNYVTVNSAASQLHLRFLPGSARLAPRDAARLARLAAAGQIRPADRVSLAAAGSPRLAERRADTVAGVLLRYGIVAAPGRRAAALPPNHAILQIGHYTVTLPPCPNWSKSTPTDFANTLSSNFGCSTMTNLGLMVARPADLVSGLPVAAADGQPAIDAVDRYLTGKVYKPTSVSSQSSAGGGGTGGGSGGGGGGR